MHVGECVCGDAVEHAVHGRQHPTMQCTVDSIQPTATMYGCRMLLLITPCCCHGRFLMRLDTAIDGSSPVPVDRARCRPPDACMIVLLAHRGGTPQEHRMSCGNMWPR